MPRVVAKSWLARTATQPNCSIHTPSFFTQTRAPTSTPLDLALPVSPPMLRVVPVHAAAPRLHKKGGDVLLRRRGGSEEEVLVSALLAPLQLVDQDPHATTTHNQTLTPYAPSRQRHGLPTCRASRCRGSHGMRVPILGEKLHDIALPTTPMPWARLVAIVTAEAASAARSRSRGEATRCRAADDVAYARSRGTHPARGYRAAADIAIQVGCRSSMLEERTSGPSSESTPRLVGFDRQ
jgi:hypothetical protein